MEKDKKTCFNAEKNDFDQPMACRAPVCWSKYTTIALIAAVSKATIRVCKFTFIPTNRTLKTGSQHEKHFTDNFLF